MCHVFKSTYSLLCELFKAVRELLELFTGLTGLVEPEPPFPRCGLTPGLLRTLVGEDFRPAGDVGVFGPK